MMARPGPVAAVLAGIALALPAGPAAADDALPTIVAAEFATPTGRYRHNIMGSIPAWAEMVLTLEDGSRRRIALPETRVFEDIAPRLADLDGDGRPEVVVVETHVRQGGSLAVYDAGGKITATPYIGTAHRWLAPAGIADFDGDGRVEIGYVDRPHMARVLRLWRYEDRGLTEVATLAGLTNHRIGEEVITGGTRDCGAGPEMVLATADWARVVAVRFDGDALSLRDVGPNTGPEAFTAALGCVATG